LPEALANTKWEGERSPRRHFRWGGTIAKHMYIFLQRLPIRHMPINTTP